MHENKRHGAAELVDRVYVPSGHETSNALVRTTHLAIGAHQDDLEIMAAHGILACYDRDDRWFTGVVVTDGRGAPRSGPYADYTDDAMHDVRIEEQRRAAELGQYTAQVLLDYPSSAVKDSACTGVVADLTRVLEATRPEVVYTHNLADKHDTHVAVTLRVVEALRGLPTEIHPREFYGCEVWRDLDWLPDDRKVLLDVSDRANLQTDLIAVFESQIAGGKRYDLAAMGRRRAHATFSASHDTDESTGLILAMDLRPLLDPQADPAAFMREHMEAFMADVDGRVRRFTSEVGA